MRPQNIVAGEYTRGQHASINKTWSKEILICFKDPLRGEELALHPSLSSNIPQHHFITLYNTQAGGATAMPANIII